MNRDEWNPNRQITNDAGVIADIMYWLGDKMVANVVSKPAPSCSDLVQGCKFTLYRGEPQGWRLL